MRSLPDGLAAEFASGATTLCRCWRALRRDGRRFGFTDHDRDLVFDGTTFQASSGLEASEAESLLGLAVGGGEIAGALSAESVSEADIEDGAWDGATVETWLVDWRDTTRRMLLDAGAIGEIRRQGGPSRRNCAASRISLIRSGAGATGRSARPSSATSAAARR